MFFPSVRVITSKNHLQEIYMSKASQKEKAEHAKAEKAAEVDAELQAQQAADEAAKMGIAEDSLTSDEVGSASEVLDLDRVDDELFANQLPTMPSEKPKLTDLVDEASLMKPGSGTDRVANVDLDKPPEDETKPNHEDPPLTEDQWAKLRVATDDAIAFVLGDESLPPKWREAFLGEQKRRADKVAADASALAALTAAPLLYRVKRGCSISHEGMLTQIAVGAVVSRETHNLEHLQASGAELEPIAGAGFETKTDQFGRPVTVIR